MRNTATRKAKDLTEFLSWVGQLEPIEFTGILKIMSVQILQNEKKPRPYEDLLSDLIDRFVEMEKKRRKELIKLVKLTVKQTKEEQKKKQKQMQKMEQNAAVPSEASMEEKVEGRIDKENSDICLDGLASYTITSQDLT